MQDEVGQSQFAKDESVYRMCVMELRILPLDDLVIRSVKGPRKGFIAKDRLFRYGVGWPKTSSVSCTTNWSPSVNPGLVMTEAFAGKPMTSPTLTAFS